MKITKVSSNYNQQTKTANAKNNNPAFGMDLRLQGPLLDIMKADTLNHSSNIYTSIIGWKTKAIDLLPKEAKAFLGFDYTTKKFFVTPKEMEYDESRNKVAALIDVYFRDISKSKKESSKATEQLGNAIIIHSLSPDA